MRLSRRTGLMFTVLAAVLLWLPGVTPAQGGVGDTDIVILGGSGAVSDAVAAQLATCTTGSVTRLAGGNRYATAVAISKWAYPAGADVVYVARGDNFPDALAGAAAAGADGGPVLLVQQNAIPGATTAELSRLAPARIVILGGTGAVSATVENLLGAIAPVNRIAGTNRYATAAMISTETFLPAVGTVYAATGENFPDALSGGPPAIQAGGPVILVQKDSVPGAVQAELTRLDPTAIKVLGGTGAVSDAVVAQLGAFANSVNRLSGNNRYATAAAVSVDSFSPGVKTILIATGENFPDALAGGAIGGIAGGPILLVQQNAMPGATENEVERLTGGTCAPPPFTFGAGTHIVGVDVPPDTYRNSGFSPGCYWERLSGFSGELSDIIANNFTTIGQIVEIEPSDVGFRSTSDCGTWSNNLAPTRSPTAALDPGTWQVPSEVAAGNWRNAPVASGCYWERLRGFSGELADIIANDFNPDVTQSIVTVSATDVGFSATDNCGVWTYLGP